MSNRLLGIVLIIVGVILLALGYAGFAEGAFQILGIVIGVVFIFVGLRLFQHRIKVLK